MACAGREDHPIVRSIACLASSASPFAEELLTADRGERGLSVRPLPPTEQHDLLPPFPMTLQVNGDVPDAVLGE